MTGRRTVRVRFLPSGNCIDVPPETLVHQAALRAGIFMDAPCGGRGTCGKCRVLLTDSRGTRSVLACRTVLTEDATIEVAPIAPPTDTPGGAAVPTALRAHPDHPLGIALDIGTTTLAAHMVDLKTGVSLASLAASNPQYAWGADVVSRLAFAGDSPENAALLHTALTTGVDRLIATLCEQSNASPSRIIRIVVAGNTAMQHFFIGVDPAALAVAPFRPPIAGEYPPFTSSAIGLRTPLPSTPVQLLPNISGWIGGDTTGVLIATGIATSALPTLAIDIGTNGELVLAAGDHLLATSTAAGPCFEGARIAQGMRATDGAIATVVLEDGDLQCGTVGSVPPLGICGSGLVDAVASLRKVGCIDASGRIPFDEMPTSIPDAIARRLRPDAPGGGGILLATGSEGEIILTQRDIREFQLAKAAIRAGAEILSAESGIGSSDRLDALLLAGAFGTRLNARSARAIGLLPNLPDDRIRSVGNAACDGARAMLLGSVPEDHVRQWLQRIRSVELGSRKDFQDAFADAMRLEPI